jgi:hypothetical protein
MLSARERKKVYMRSSIFDAEGPSVKNIYSRKRQESVLAEVQTLEAAARVPPDPSQFALPNPADMRLSQNAGHNVVFGEGSEDVPDIHALKETSIPREYWKSDVNLHWADPRNELNRSRAVAHPPEETSARGRATFEMSSELFDWERMTNVSTQHPTKEILSCAEHFLAPQPDHMTETGAKDAGERMRMNLEESKASFFKRETSPEPKSVVANENPDGAARRRNEKNFSDMFETSMPERHKVKQRCGASDSMSLSWLDARAEVEAREKGALQGHVSENTFEKYDPVERRLNELQSRVTFGEEAEPVEGSKKALRTDDQEKERICWETGTLMESTSELARREMSREYGSDQSAWARKKAEQSSSARITDIHQMPAEPAELKPPRMTIPPIHEGVRERPLSAFARKQSNLASNIF